MSEHTKEPWHTGKNHNAERFIYGEDGWAIAECVQTKDKMFANASRIVACVNSCAGVETENISNFRLAAALSYWKNLESQREEMLAALHAVSSWIRNIPHGENCFVSSHYDGDPGNQCNCGKESILDFVESEISKAEATS